MPKLIDAESGLTLAEISDDQLDFMVEQLEEEDREDQDYFLDLDVIDLMEENGADEGLILLLRRALGSNEGIDIRWQR